MGYKGRNPPVLADGSQVAPLAQRARRLWGWRGLLAGGVALVSGGSLRGSSHTDAANSPPCATPVLRQSMSIEIVVRGLKIRWTHKSQAEPDGKDLSPSHI